MKMKLKKTAFLKLKVPFPLVILLVPIIACATYFVGQKSTAEKEEPPNGCNPKIDQIRRQDYEFTRPLLLTNITTEDSRLDTIKNHIAIYINSRAADGTLQNASVYLRISGAWMAINSEERYSSGSLLKLPLLIYFLKESEKNPSILGKAIYFGNHFNVPRKPEIVEQPLQPGRTYTVEELLRRMIVYSDNDATILLTNLAGPGAEADLYDALHLTQPDAVASDYFINVEEYSRFFRVLFNATYLDPSLSDYALKLLSQSSYRGGLVRGLDPSIKVPRKFAERGKDGISEFHEMGIVYMKKDPYILGVMTRGRDLRELQDVVADISEIVYTELSKHTITF